MGFSDADRPAVPAFKSAFRIVHRSLFLRFFNPHAPDSMCRLCRCAPERFSHLAECECIGFLHNTFDFFVAFSHLSTWILQLGGTRLPP